MKMKHCLHYLEEEPEVVRAKSGSKVEKIGNKLYGTNASAGINEWGRELLKDYMLKGIVQVKNVCNLKKFLKEKYNCFLHT